MSKRKRREWKTRWMTAEGDIVRIIDMEDRHLRNTIRMLTRWADAEIERELDAAFRCSTMFSGENATDLIEQGIDDLLDVRPQDYAYEVYKAYPRMVKEAEKRGLRL